MLNHYLLLALRTLRRQKAYAAINVVGLAVGIACCLLLLLFVQDERSYDRFHDDPEHVFRISARFDGREIALNPPMVAELLATELPAVEAATRLRASSGLVRAGETVRQEPGFFFADASVFDVLTHAFLRGDAETALVRPNTVVLTASAARHYFGDADPVGQTLTRNEAQAYEVTGVIEDVPANAHYRFDFLAALDAPAQMGLWSDANYHTYVRTHRGVDAATLRAQIGGLITRLEAEEQEPWELSAMPITDVHLYGRAEYELDAGGDIRVVYGLTVVALLILLIACINYMNLATARAVQRAGEVGLRKALGAYRRQLVAQFYGESAVLAAGGVLLALVLVALALPASEAISGKPLAFGALFAPAHLALLAGAFVGVTLVAGSYPALYLSAFSPARVMRGGMRSTIRRSGRGPSRLRQGLVVFQFAISAALIAGTLVVLSQLRFLQDQPVGFDREHVVVLPLSDPLLRAAYPAMAAAMTESPRVRAAAGVNQIPGELGWTSQFAADGMGDDAWFYVKGLPADADVSDALGLALVAGEPFPLIPPAPDRALDAPSFLFLLNETTVRRLGWTPQEAVGRPVRVDNRHGIVQGVVQDFHFQSMRADIEPLAVWYEPDAVYNLAVRLAPGPPRAALDDLERVWGQFASHRPFAYRFLDDVYDGLYRSEQQLGRVVTACAGLAIFLACLGLLGLAAFTAQQRTQEVGVRKVLGASVASLVALLSKDFLLLVGVALVVGVPVAWVGMARWLDGFAYHVPLGPLPFLLAGIVLLGLALVTVSTQALRAATADPVRSIRAS